MPKTIFARKPFDLDQLKSDVADLKRLFNSQGDAYYVAEELQLSNQEWERLTESFLDDRFCFHQFSEKNLPETEEGTPCMRVTCPSSEIALIIDTLKEFNAPFSVNQKKTRYGSSSGKNWNLGLMFNKDNEITVGSANINLIKVMTHNFILDTLNDKRWDRQKILQYQGLLQYFRFIQPERINGIIEKYSKKYNVDLLHLIRMELKR